MTVCVSEFPCKYSFQERALVAFKPRPILFIMNKICLNQENCQTEAHGPLLDWASGRKAPVDLYAAGFCYHNWS